MVVDLNNLRVSYITDIHITGNDVACESRYALPTDKFAKPIYKDIDKNVKTIVDEMDVDVLLIGGDISRDFVKFEEFICKLHSSFLSKYNNLPLIVIIMGNHELIMNKNVPSNEEFLSTVYGKNCNCSNEELNNKSEIDRLVCIYRAVCTYYGMVLLHNDLLIVSGVEEADNISILKSNVLYEDTINNMSIEELSNSIKQSSVSNTLFFGSLGLCGGNVGFKGYKEWNGRFKNIYAKIDEATRDYYLVTLLHTPMEYDGDWFYDLYKDNKIFVFGHTHNPIFLEDGIIRIYGDNQIGYEDSCRLKFFNVISKNVFDKYSDGIYEVDCRSYSLLYRYLNIDINIKVSRINKLYMLKRDKYYMFIHEAKNKNLTVLNGGQRIGIRQDNGYNLQYYYDNMLNIANSLHDITSGYLKVQGWVSDFVKQIGGAGTIHGCIIDITSNSHIFINPKDLSMMYYYFDMMNMSKNKYYNSIFELLRHSGNIEIYKNYIEYCKELTLLRYVDMEEDNGREADFSYIHDTSTAFSKLSKIKYGIIVCWLYDDNDREILYSTYKTEKSQRIERNMDIIKNLINGEEQV